MDMIRAGMRYSPLKQITPTNVTKLVRAWTYDTSEGSKRPRAEEVTPLVVERCHVCPELAMGASLRSSRKRGK